MSSMQFVTPRKNAIRRLMADLSDWQRNRHEFPCINAIPLDDNIFEWHCNLAANSGVLKGAVLHLILIFPDNYPSQPPKVKLCTSIPHPNVFGDWICLDMIRTYEQGQYKGWTPAYSVGSILMQLQTFLFEENGIDQDGGYQERNRLSWSNAKGTIRKISKFECGKCGHNRDNIFPSVGKKTTLMKKKINKPKQNKNKNNKREEMNRAVLMSFDDFAKLQKKQSTKKNKKGNNKKDNNSDLLATPNKVLTLKQYNKRLTRMQEVRCEKGQRINNNNNNKNKVATGKSTDNSNNNENSATNKPVAIVSESASQGKGKLNTRDGIIQTH